MFLERPLHDFPNFVWDSKRVVNTDLRENGKTVNEFVDPFDRCRDVSRRKNDPAHLQCAIECSQ